MTPELVQELEEVLVGVGHKRPEARRMAASMKDQQVKTIQEALFALLKFRDEGVEKVEATKAILPSKDALPADQLETSNLPGLDDSTQDQPPDQDALGAAPPVDEQAETTGDWQDDSPEAQQIKDAINVPSEQEIAEARDKWETHKSDSVQKAEALRAEQAAPQTPPLPETPPTPPPSAAREEVVSENKDKYGRPVEIGPRIGPRGGDSKLPGTPSQKHGPTQLPEASASQVDWRAVTQLLFPRTRRWFRLYDLLSPLFESGSDEETELSPQEQHAQPPEAQPPPIPESFFDEEQEFGQYPIFDPEEWDAYQTAPPDEAEPSPEAPEALEAKVAEKHKPSQTMDLPGNLTQIEGQHMLGEDVETPAGEWQQQKAHSKFKEAAEQRRASGRFTPPEQFPYASEHKKSYATWLEMPGEHQQIQWKQHAEEVAEQQAPTLEREDVDPVRARLMDAPTLQPSPTPEIADERRKAELRSEAQPPQESSHREVPQFPDEGGSEHSYGPDKSVETLEKVIAALNKNNEALNKLSDTLTHQKPGSGETPSKQTIVTPSGKTQTIEKITKMKHDPAIHEAKRTAAITLLQRVVNRVIGT